MTPPAEIKAVVITKPGTAEIKTVSLPRLRDDYILVRTTVVAVNPADWKHVDMPVDGNVGARVGSDYAGVVEQVGGKVTKSFAKGDRICGFAHGSNQTQHEDGTFAEYIMVKGDVAIKIPDHMSDEQAATLGAGIITVGQSLYQALKLPLPVSGSSSPPLLSPKSPQILIYGGSTASGLLGIQLARLSGYRVATTCSPSNFAYVKSLGADAAFDYRSPTVVADIKAWSRGDGDGDGGDDDDIDDVPLTLAWDCIATPDSARICAGCLSGARGGTYRALGAVDDAVVKGVNERVDNGFTVAFTALGEAFDVGFVVPAVPEDFEFAKMFGELVRELLAEGQVRAVRVDVNCGGKGLEGTLVGMRELREGRVSGSKLVYTL
ncbi:Protein TOXD [Madurella mycetomatis]|uniref:Protein TOXD n=1 Tax=Madurella mycetomatis TaxID=100816 RepID=A0A175WE34_9PEZI|nr:Protein TOXD [Madurella mycetomatis]